MGFEYMKILKNLLYQCKVELFQYKKQFFILLAVYLLAFCSIFRANYAYWDDIGRTYAGYHGWLDWSRYGTELLATFVHASWHLTDISPFPQILACAVMAAGGLIVLVLFKNGNRLGIWHVLAVALTALTPYFLGMISYKFDSPYMALSFLASVFPFLYRKSSSRTYIIVSVLCLLVMCTTYQASSGIYPTVALYLVMQDILSGHKTKDSLRFLGVSALCYLGALGVFWLLLMRDNGVSVFSLPNLFSFVAKRYVTYYKIIYHDFTKIWIALIIMLIIIFLYSVCKSAKINKFAALALGIFAILAGSFLCFGANLYISRNAYDTRSMYGFNVLLTLMAVFIAFHAKHWIYKAAYVVLTWCFFVFALTYGNALSLQQDYMHYRTELLVSDLNDLEIMNSDGVKSVSIIGDIGYSPAIMNMAEDYPILDRAGHSGDGDGLICTGLGEGIWGGYYFYNYLNIKNIENGGSDIQDQSLPILKDTMYHTIKGSGNKVVVELK